jgi:hypothetical protein
MRPRGERAYNAKLTGVQVEEIRRLAAAGVSRRTLGAKYGVSGRTISGVALGKSWIHVGGPTGPAPQDVWACGERAPNAKLTDVQVEQIRHRAAAGEYRQHLSAEYGVSLSVGSSIAVGRSWRHANGPRSLAPPMVGERIVNSKLKTEQVIEIRSRHKAGESLRALARGYNVTPQNIRYIVRGKTWKHDLDGVLATRDAPV